MNAYLRGFKWNFKFKEIPIIGTKLQSSLPGKVLKMIHT